jgi:hypothetical protein
MYIVQYFFVSLTRTWGHIRKSHGWSPSASPSSCYASPSSTLSCMLLPLCSHEGWSW